MGLLLEEILEARYWTRSILRRICLIKRQYREGLIIQRSIHRSSSLQRLSITCKGLRQRRKGIIRQCIMEISLMARLSYLK